MTHDASINEATANQLWNRVTYDSVSQYEDNLTEKSCNFANGGKVQEEYLQTAQRLARYGFKMTPFDFELPIVTGYGSANMLVRGFAIDKRGEPLSITILTPHPSYCKTAPNSEHAARSACISDWSTAALLYAHSGETYTPNADSSFLVAEALQAGQKRSRPYEDTVASALDDVLLQDSTNPKAMRILRKHEIESGLEIAYHQLGPGVRRLVDRCLDQAGVSRATLPDGKTVLAAYCSEASKKSYETLHNDVDERGRNGATRKSLQTNATLRSRVDKEGVTDLHKKVRRNADTRRANAGRPPLEVLQAFYTSVGFEKEPDKDILHRIALVVLYVLDGTPRSTFSKSKRFRPSAAQIASLRAFHKTIKNWPQKLEAIDKPAEWVHL